MDAQRTPGFGRQRLVPRAAELGAPVFALLPDASETGNDKSRCNKAIGYGAALESARRIVRHETWTAIYPQDDHPNLWEISFSTSDNGDASVVADLACGTISVHETAKTRSARHTAEFWLSGLHDGTVFGLPGEIAVTLPGVVPLVLLWTGIRMWQRGRQHRSRHLDMYGARQSSP